MNIRRLLFPQDVAKLVVFLAAQQHAGKNVIDWLAIAVCQTNHYLGKEIRVQVKIHMFRPVFRRVIQFCATALLKLQIEQQNIRRIQIVAGQFQKDVVSLFQRFVLFKSIIKS